MDERSLSGIHYWISNMRTMQAVTEHLFEEVKRCHRENGGKLTDQMLSTLDSIFQGILLQGLDLIDRQQVSLILTPSGRSIFQVQGCLGANYLCLRATNYCTCSAYQYSVIRRGEQSMCKHILACRLSEAMECYKELHYSDETLALMLLEMQ